MSIRQVEKLYKKMIDFDSLSSGKGSIDSSIRSDIFQKIMDDVERLRKRIKRCRKGSQEYRDIDIEIRKLLLKEIQVIIDDYIISQKNGKLRQWKAMYGDIDHYIQNFYTYRQECISGKSSNQDADYGFCEVIDDGRT